MALEMKGIIANIELPIHMLTQGAARKKLSPGFLVSLEIEELNTDNASSVAFHILRNFIQQQAEKIMEDALFLV